MKILLVTGCPFYPLRYEGAERLSHYLLSALIRNYGVNCQVVCLRKDSTAGLSLVPEKTSWSILDIRSIEEHADGSLRIDCGYPIHAAGNVMSAFEEALSSYRPDIVWAQLDGAADFLAVARKQQIPALLYVLTAKLDPQEVMTLAAASTGIVCLSHFLRRWLEKTVGVTADVVYPIFEAREIGAPKWPNGAITMVNAFQVKGVNTFLEIAKRLPDEKFQLLEAWPLRGCLLDDLKSVLPSNVLFHRRRPDPFGFYRESKLHLVPSTWEEAFGLVVLEAQSLGIPVIASCRGGLPEAVSEGGMLIDDYLNPSAWIEAITSLLQDRKRYLHLSAKAYNNTRREQYSSQNNAALFYQIILRRIG